MEDDDADHDERIPGTNDLTELVGDAISECLTDVEIEIEPEDRVILAEELIGKFTSPLMIQRAAGATSRVTVTMSPVGGVEHARSVKARNAIVNLKQAAIAAPTSLAAFASLFQKFGVTATVGTSALAILYLFGILKPISEILRVPLTKQAAAILLVMWDSKKENEETVPHMGLLVSVNSRFKSYEWNEITADELVSYLESLEKIGSIERDSSFDSIAIGSVRWRLKETVKISY